MKLRSLRIRGIGPRFPDEITLDLDAIDGDLIAITGDNGAGKSTLLECYAAALHPSRKMPTRGSIDGLAHEEDDGAFVEVVFDHGPKTIKIRHEPSRSLSHVWINGEPVPLDGGKVSRFADWARSNLLPPEVVTASIFLGQRSEGLVDADGADRREALLRAIGVEEIEALAKKARQHLTAEDKALAEARQHLDLLRTGAWDVAEAEQQRDGVAEQRRGAREALTAAEDRQHAARAELAAHDAREAARSRLLAERAQCATRLLAAVQKHQALGARLAAEQATLHDAETLRAHAARAREMDARIADLRARHATALAAADRVGAETSAHLRDAEAAHGRWKAAERRRADVARRLQDQDAIAAAVASLVAHRARVEAAEATLAVATAQAEDARAKASQGTAGRVQALRSGLRAVEAADCLDAAQAIAGDALRADDAIESVQLGPIDAKAAEARADLDAARRALSSAERLAARADDVAAAVQLHAEAQTEMTAAEQGEQHARAAAMQKSAEHDARVADIEKIGADLRALTEEADRLRPDVEREAGLAGVEARVAEIALQVNAAAADVAALRAEEEALPSLPDPLPAPDLRAIDAEVRRLSEQLTGLAAELAVAERDLVTAREAAAEIDAIEASLPPLEERRADAALLAEALGTTGVQALEIDAAGPALTATMNTLLHHAYGARFTAEIVTTKKRRNLEETEILVTDTLTGGGRRDVRTYSGGERVPLATAAFLSLAIYLCRSRGLSAPTLILDEPGSGLDEHHVEQWLGMLRAAATMAGASKTIVITHDPRLIDAADRVVRVAGGRVTVVR